MPLERCIAERGALDQRYRLQLPNGETRWALARRCHCDEQGRPLRFPGAVMDISRQQASEDALRQSEAELKMITDALPVLIGYLDHKERFRFNNRYYTEWFGYPTQWLLGKTAREVLGEQGYAEREQSIRAALAGQQVVFEAYSPHRDGQARRMLVHYLPRRDAQGAVLGFFVMALDVTERWRAEQALRELNETLESRIQERTQALAEVYERLLKEMASREQAQEALRQSQKMEAVGQLTGGIAHDFNNMLTGIIGGLDLIQRYIQSGRHGETQRFIDAAVTSANRAAALTHRLLAFARRQPLNLKRVELNQLIESMHDLLSRTLGRHIQIRNQLQAGLGRSPATRTSWKALCSTWSSMPVTRCPTAARCCWKPATPSCARARWATCRWPLRQPLPDRYRLRRAPGAGQRVRAVLHHRRSAKDRPRPVDGLRLHPPGRRSYPDRQRTGCRNAGQPVPAGVRRAGRRCGAGSGNRGRPGRGNGAGGRGRSRGAAAGDRRAADARLPDAGGGGWQCGDPHPESATAVDMLVTDVGLPE